MTAVGAVASAETKDTPAAIAQTSATAAPSPAPASVPASTPAPSAFKWGGYERSYYFTRYNGGTAENQASENNAIDVRGSYDLGGGLSIGAQYLFADPFNGCQNAYDATHAHAGNSCLMLPTKPDNTLPGYELNTLYEAYLKYDANGFNFQGGDMVINTPWANASDSRLKPAAFQGATAGYRLNKNWTIDAGYFDRWENRVQSSFVNSTLITQNGAYPDDGGVNTTGIPAGGVIATNGWEYGHLGYSGKPFAANGYVYAFQNIANMFWGDATYHLDAHSVWNPFIAIQGGTESNTGSSFAGKIASQVIGAEAGVDLAKGITLTAGWNYVPQKSDTYAAGSLPGNAVCSQSLGSIDNLNGDSGYFLPNGGTPSCHVDPATGATTVYYGGWASPYTDSYATDPLFTTSISQGMADRHSPGTGFKVALTGFSANKQLRIITSEAFYEYGNDTAGVAPTQEFDLDATWFFSKPGKGPYHGFSLRHRYADRVTWDTAFFGGINDFKYNRTQLEYDF